jgi:hypothetical protein
VKCSRKLLSGFLKKSTYVTYRNDGVFLYLYTSVQTFRSFSRRLISSWCKYICVQLFHSPAPKYKRVRVTFLLISGLSCRQGRLKISCATTTTYSTTNILFTHECVREHNMIFYNIKVPRRNNRSYEICCMYVVLVRTHTHTYITILVGHESWRTTSNTARPLARYYIITILYWYCWDARGSRSERSMDRNGRVERAPGNISTGVSGWRFSRFG